MGNPRYANGQLRRRNRARLRAMGGECGICHGRFGPIHYDEPSDAQHPLSFVVDEIKPVSRWREFGYPSARAAAEDWSNLQPAHWFCNAAKGNKNRAKRPENGQIRADSEGFRRRLVRGWGGAPRPRPRRPLCRPAPIYTQEKFQRTGERVSGHGDHEKHHGTGHPGSTSSNSWPRCWRRASTPARTAAPCPS